MNSERIGKNAYILKELESAKGKVDQMTITAALLMDEETWIARPKVEQYFKEYRVDICYLDLKWIIEIDEIQHSYPIQSEKDRQQDIELGKLGYETTRIKVYENEFIHADEIKKLKSILINKVKDTKSFQPWLYNEFDIDQAHKDDPTLVFVNKGSDSNPFPLLKLSKEISERKDLKIVILSESPNFYKGSNLKMVEGVYSFEPFQKQIYGGGYISWSGNPIQHSILKSGDTAVNLTKGPAYLI